MAVAAVGFVLALGLARVGVALVAHARARTAADAGALAAAEGLALGADPATAAAEAAAAAHDDGAARTTCAWAGPRVVVDVEVDVPVLGRVARARAAAEVRGVVVPAP